jgi:hypothetical protein
MGQFSNSNAGGSVNFAVPATLVGLAPASAGVAATAIRSDAKLALSQAITPTWTGRHIFSGNGGIQAIQIVGNDPTFLMQDSNMPADQQNWEVQGNSGAFRVFAVNGAMTVSSQGLSITNTATGTVANVTLGNATDNPTYTLLGTGLTTMGGGIRTQDPGSGVATWKMGRVVAGAVALDAANYVEVDIAGVIVKLLKAA